MNFGGGGRQRLVFSSNLKWGCMRVINFRAHFGQWDLQIICSTLYEFGVLSIAYYESLVVLSKLIDYRIVASSNARY